MSPIERAVLRFLGIWAVFAGVELVERAAYRAGAAAVVDEHLADELVAFDAGDVVLAHVRVFHGPDAPRAGECLC